MADEPDEFEKMFDDLAKIGDPAPGAVPVEEPAPVVLGAEPPAPEEVPAEEPVEALDTTPPADEPEVTPEPAPGPSNDELLARFAQIVRETPAPQPQVQRQPAPQAQPLFTAAEQAELAAYEKDWPDVAKAEALRRRAEYHQLIQYVFDQVGQRLAPLEQVTMGGAERSHLNDIYSLVPDYDAVRDPVLAWVDQQPAYLKAAYQSVARSGTPMEVADLIGRYRQANGAPAPQAAPAAQTAPAPQVRRAAAALAPVKSARSGVTDSQPDDFDGAFAAFAKAI
jgi:hypothetical protein